MSKTKKVLLIDAEKRLPEITQKIFDCYELNIAVIAATDGREGIELAKYLQPDLVLSEVLLEHATGFDVCTSLKNHHRTREIPFIFLTTQTSLNYKATGLYRGADAYITKPFKYENLAKRVKELTNGEWRRYKVIHRLVDGDLSAVMGEYEYNGQQKTMSDYVAVENGRIIEEKTASAPELGHELKLTNPFLELKTRDIPPI